MSRVQLATEWTDGTFMTDNAGTETSSNDHKRVRAPHN